MCHETRSINLSSCVLDNCWAPSRSPQNNDLVVAFESAWTYGLNVTARPDAETFPNNGVRTSDNVSHSDSFGRK